MGIEASDGVSGRSLQEELYELSRNNLLRELGVEDTSDETLTTKKDEEKGPKQGEQDPSDSQVLGTSRPGAEASVGRSPSSRSSETSSANDQVLQKVREESTGDTSTQSGGQAGSAETGVDTQTTEQAGAAETGADAQTTEQAGSAETGADTQTTEQADTGATGVDTQTTEQASSIDSESTPSSPLMDALSADYPDGVEGTQEMLNAVGEALVGDLFDGILSGQLENADNSTIMPNGQSETSELRADGQTSLPSDQEHVDIAKLEGGIKLEGDSGQSVEVINASDESGDSTGDGKTTTEDSARDYLEAFGGMLDGQLNNVNNTTAAVRDADGKFTGLAFKHKSDTHGEIHGFISKEKLDKAMSGQEMLGAGAWSSLGKDQGELKGLLDQAHDAKMADVDAHGGKDNYNRAEELRGRIQDASTYLSAEQNNSESAKQLNDVIERLNTLTKSDAAAPDKEAKLAELEQKFDEMMAGDMEMNKSLLNDRISELKQNGISDEKIAALTKSHGEVADLAAAKKLDEQIDAAIDEARDQKQAFKDGERDAFEADHDKANELLSQIEESGKGGSEAEMARKLADHIKAVAEGKNSDMKGQYLKAMQKKLDRKLAALSKSTGIRPGASQSDSASRPPAPTEGTGPSGSGQGIPAADDGSGRSPITPDSLAQLENSIEVDEDGRVTGNPIDDPGAKRLMDLRDADFLEKSLSVDRETLSAYSEAGLMSDKENDSLTSPDGDKESEASRYERLMGEIQAFSGKYGDTPLGEETDERLSERLREAKALDRTAYQLETALSQRSMIDEKLKTGMADAEDKLALEAITDSVYQDGSLLIPELREDGALEKVLELEDGKSLDFGSGEAGLRIYNVDGERFVDFGQAGTAGKLGDAISMQDPVEHQMLQNDDGQYTEAVPVDKTDHLAVEDNDFANSLSSDVFVEQNPSSGEAPRVFQDNKEVKPDENGVYQLAKANLITGADGRVSKINGGKGNYRLENGKVTELEDDASDTTSARTDSAGTEAATGGQFNDEQIAKLDELLSRDSLKSYQDQEYRDQILGLKDGQSVTFEGDEEAKRATMSFYNVGGELYGDFGAEGIAGKVSEMAGANSGQEYQMLKTDDSYTEAIAVDRVGHLAVENGSYANDLSSDAFIETTPQGDSPRVFQANQEVTPNANGYYKLGAAGQIVDSEGNVSKTHNSIANFKLENGSFIKVDD